jgi:large subunit ribosomal protein L24
MKLKKGDKIIITSGKDRGKKGRIEKIFPKNGKVLIPGLNLFKRHMKKKDEKNPGGIIEFSRPLPICNVVLICSRCGKPTRVGYKRGGEENSRFCRKCKTVI